MRTGSVRLPWKRRGHLTGDFYSNEAAELKTELQSDQVIDQGEMFKMSGCAVNHRWGWGGESVVSR